MGNSCRSSPEHLRTPHENRKSSKIKKDNETEEEGKKITMNVKVSTMDTQKIIPVQPLCCVQSCQSLQ